MASLTETAKRLKYKREQRDLAIEALNELLRNGEIESYSFGDSDGNQSARRRRISELQEFISAIEKEIDALERSLQGGGIMTFGTNRYG